MKTLHEQKAQTSMESLTLIGGAVAIAVVIGLAIKQAASNIGQTGSSALDNTP